MERYRKMAFTTNYNLNSFDLLGNNWQYGSGIAGLFNNVPGMNTSVFNYGSPYYSTGTSTSNGNSALGWALGGIGVGVLGILATSLISKSQANNARIESENSQNLSNLKAALKDLGIDDDVESVTEDAINNIKVDESSKDAPFYAPVKEAENSVQTLTEARESAVSDANEQLKNINTPNGATCNINIKTNSISSSIKSLIELKCKWEAEKDAGKRDNETEAETAARKEIAERNVTALQKIRENLELWETGNEKDKELKEADEALKKAKKEAETALEAKQKEAIKYLKAYNNGKLSSRSINNADGTAIGRLFAQKNATVSKDGDITLNQGKNAKDLTEGDIKTILARYRKGDTKTKDKIGEWVAKKINVEDIQDKDCRELIKIIKNKYKTTE